MSCICRLEVVVLILFAMDFVSRDVEDMLFLLQVLISKVRRVLLLQNGSASLEEQRWVLQKLE